MIPKNPENMCRELETHFDVLSCMIVDAVEADAWYFLVKKKKKNATEINKIYPLSIRTTSSPLWPEEGRKVVPFSVLHVSAKNPTELSIFYAP